MSQYTSLSKPELERLKDALQASYQEQKELGLTLNMARESLARSNWTCPWIC